MTPETAARLKELEPGWDWNVSLTKLLSRIEKEGYDWRLCRSCIGICKDKRITFNGNPDEAAGQALVWILEKKDG